MCKSFRWNYQKYHIVNRHGSVNLAFGSIYCGPPGSFEIVNYPDLSGNIPKDNAYGIYTSQIIRYARVCSEAVDFMERVKILFGKLVKKGYEKT